MEKMHFEVEINAPASKVFTTVTNDKSYREWTAPFNPSSYFKGGWNKGDKMLFLGVNKEGKTEGMVARIVENIPGRQISIQHLGMLDGEKEVTEGPAVEGWAGAMEEYFLEEKEGETIFRVAVDTHPDYKDYFNNTWPKALAVLKDLSEK